MSWAVWTEKKYHADEGMPSFLEQGDSCLLMGIPTYSLAERLCARVKDIYGDETARIEKE